MLPSREDVVATAKVWDIPVAELDEIHEISLMVSNMPTRVRDQTTKPPKRNILQQPFQSEKLSQRLDGLNEYINALGDPSLEALLQLLIKDHQNSSRQQISVVNSKGVFSNILWATHSLVLQAVAEGNIAQKYFSDENTRLLLDYLAQESAATRVRPGIYCNAIGNKHNGEFLSTKQTCQVLDIMELYVKSQDRELVQTLDNLINLK
jgi:hypothetical protein